MLGAGHTLDDLKREFSRDHQIFVFVHLHKTGGSSVDSMLMQDFGDTAVVYHNTGDAAQIATLMKEGRFSRGRHAIFGHRAIGIDEILPGDLPILRFTFLRDPISRFASFYSYGCLRWGHTRLSAREYMDSLQPNAMVRFFQRTTAEEVQELFENNYHFVGTTGEFSRSIQLLHRLMDLPSKQYLRKTVIREEHKRDIPADVEAEFRERNAEDLKLYEWVSETTARGLESANDLLGGGDAPVFETNESSFVKPTRVNFDLERNNNKFSLLLTGMEAWKDSADRSWPYFEKAVSVDIEMTLYVARFLREHKPAHAKAWVRSQLDIVPNIDEKRIKALRRKLVKIAEE